MVAVNQKLRSANGMVARLPPRASVPKGEAAAEASSAAVSCFHSLQNNPSPVLLPTSCASALG
jgi:hypothetical protein